MTFDWVIRNDPCYVRWAINLELQDRIEDPLTIFAHYCMEYSNLAESLPARMTRAAGGPCDMVLTTFTGLGKSLRTGGATIDLFEMRAQDILSDKKQAKGFTITPKQLKKAISLVVEGQNEP